MSETHKNRERDKLYTREREKQSELVYIYRDKDICRYKWVKFKAV